MADGLFAVWLLLIQVAENAARLGLQDIHGVAGGDDG